MKYLFKLISVVTIFCFAVACTGFDYDDVNKNVDLPNSIYMEGVSETPLSYVTMDNVSVKTSIMPRLANISSKNVELSLSVSESALNSYNEKNGKNYKLLPEAYYTLGAESVTIEAGSIAGAPIDVEIKPLTGADINPSYKYAIPISISSSEGAQILQSNSTKILIINSKLNTTVLEQRNGIFLEVSFAEALQVGDEWTLHYGFNADNTRVPNQAVLSSSPERPYSRIVASGNIQFKVGGTDDPLAFTKTAFDSGKWYHLTWVYKNQDVKCYVNGVLDAEFKVPEVTYFENFNMSWGAFKGMVRDIRLYKKALPKDYILENLYVEDPANPDLVFYTPLTQEDGIKDVVGGRHFLSKKGSSDYPESSLTWISKTFPE